MLLQVWPSSFHFCIGLTNSSSLSELVLLTSNTTSLPGSAFRKFLHWNVRWPPAIQIIMRKLKSSGNYIGAIFGYGNHICRIPKLLEWLHEDKILHKYYYEWLELHELVLSQKSHLSIPFMVRVPKFFKIAWDSVTIKQALCSNLLTVTTLLAGCPYNRIIFLYKSHYCLSLSMACLQMKEILFENYIVINITFHTVQKYSWKSRSHESDLLCTYLT